MVTIGDVLAVAASLVGMAATAWATLLALSLLFPSRAERAAESIRVSPGKMGAIGLLSTLLLLTVSLVLLQQPFPLLKLAGWMVALSLLSLAALGASGLAMILAERVRDREPELSPYASIVRGAALVVVPGLLPILGWFLLAPAVLVLGVGAGLKALRLPEAAELSLAP